MEIEELKALLEELPSEHYLDKLIKASEIRKQDIPEENEDYLDKLIKASKIHEANIPEINEDYLDKLIKASEIEPGSLE